MICALNGRLPPLVDPEIARDFVYVDDAIDAFLLAATTQGDDPGAIYNVGSGDQTTLRDLVAVVRRELGVEAEPEWGSMPDRQWDTKVWVAARDKITTTLGWQPRHALPEGVRAMAAWFRDQPKLRQHYESQCLK